MKNGNLNKAVCLLLLAASVLSACAAIRSEGGGKEVPAVIRSTEQKADAESVAEIKSLSAATDTLTLWSTYWDNDNDLSVMREMAGNYEDISLFAAYYTDGKIAVPEATTRSLSELRRKRLTEDKEIYLSVVNDSVRNSKTEQKSSKLLWELIGTRESAAVHARELVDLAVRNGYDGIEIDYENIRDDLELWDAFITFEEYLLAASKKAGLKVRILLEPLTPMSELSGRFPEGPEYVIMCYNLHGGGTEPGPKADPDFLAEIYEKFKSLPNTSYGLANGGYEWTENEKKAVQIKRAKIERILSEQKKAPIRDDKSKALYFSYELKGKEHIIWYADEVTLSEWAKKLTELSGEKVRISYWRL